MIKRTRTGSLAERIERDTAPEPTSGCWLWTGTLYRGGPYGKVAVTVERNRRIAILSHRASYQVHVGPIPDGMVLDHLCRNPACVNPDHLEPVTQRENIRRSPIHMGAKTHCPQGHPYDEANTYGIVRSNGQTGRGCRKCRQAATRRAHAKTAAMKAQIVLPPGDPRHGRPVGYDTYKCRCELCRGWLIAKKAAYRAAKKAVAA